MTTEKKYINHNLKYPYCPGCGHTLVIKAINEALIRRKKDPKQVNIITDIGCVGLTDKLFLTNTIHTTHGRSTAVATGLSLANKIIFDRDVDHIVLIGDGGSTIGISHLIEAARLNINITVVLHNNFLYGMTGGQHSSLTPLDFRTSTTMDGNLLPPISIIELLNVARAGFLARKLATDEDLSDELLKAINYKGFSLVEVIEICTGYATKWNKMSKNDIKIILKKAKLKKNGTIKERKTRKSFDQVYKATADEERELNNIVKIPVIGASKAESPFSIVIAGTAGEGVQFSSRMLMMAGVSSGLQGFQKNHNPVTVGSGFSLSEIYFSPEQIYFPVKQNPDYIVITTIEGFNKVEYLFEKLDEKSLIIIDNSLPPLKTKAQVIRKDMKKAAKKKKMGNIIALGLLLRSLKLIPIESFEQAIKIVGKREEETIAALQVGYSL